MGRKLNEDEVVRQLSKKNDVSISGKEVRILSNEVFDEKTKGYVPNHFKKHDVGNGSWGKIDFLVNHCDYRKYYVDKF